MKIKKALKMAAAGVLMVGVGAVGTAGAANIDVNIYGASAQYLFWNALAPNFLASQGCGTPTQGGDGTHGAISASGCNGGTNTITIRYSSKASYDGIRAMKGIGNPDTCPTNFMRKMRKSPTDAATACYDVTLGASDVAGESFIQQSHGQLKGHLGGGWTDMVFNGEDASGLTAYNPLVVPFGFFANNTVTMKKCTAGAADKIGEQCSANDQCGAPADSPVCGAQAKLDGISRLMAAQIFSGQVVNWTDFGSGFNSNPIVACMRHAGSGTHATLDLAVMRGTDWGWPLMIDEIVGAAYFNEKSGDMMNCINENAGAIGYADADQANKTNTYSMKYNGVKPNRRNIRNGIYDNFWSKQWLYEDPSEPNYALTHPVVVNMMNYASNPANVPAAKADFWATKNEMQYMKGVDKEYPGFTGATTPYPYP